MPIQFRCQHCSQLLGISRRKAGQEVPCPSCGAATRVPIVSGGPAAAGEPVLERSDFDIILQPLPVGSSAPPAVLAEGQGPAERPPSTSGLSGRQVRVGGPGWFVTPGLATVFAVFGVLLLAGAFLAGLFFGRSLR
jgi:hypothetical protein